MPSNRRLPQTEDNIKQKTTSNLSKPQIDHDLNNKMASNENKPPIEEDLKLFNSGIEEKLNSACIED